MFRFYDILRSKAGRNNSGSITVRHRGGAIVPKLSQNYFNFKSAVDFSAFKQVVSSSGQLSFVTKASSSTFDFINTSTSALPARLYTFRSGTFVCNIESFPGSGPVYSRARYSRSMVIRRLGTNTVVKLPSGEVRKFKALCYAFSSKNESYVRDWIPKGKAGANRNLGVRPHVRGCAINPVDHPHGGRTGESRPSVSPWAVLTKGYRTRLKIKNKKIVYISVQELKNKIRNKLIAR
jgi:large subunit ribosomal protein L2